jgi:transcriptional regulator with XRE-family HTH domain
MGDLRKTFGRLVAAHRKRRGMTQETLAKAAKLSPDMIGKIETGTSGARFPAIERIAGALDVDPAELFTTEVLNGAIRRGVYSDISIHLAGLSEADLGKVLRVLEAIKSK